MYYICLLCVLGNGIESYFSNIEESFENVERTVMNNGTKLNIAATSCRIVNWSELESEIINNNLMRERRWISTEISGFTTSMCVIVRKWENSISRINVYSNKILNVDELSNNNIKCFSAEVEICRYKCSREVDFKWNN